MGQKLSTLTKCDWMCFYEKMSSMKEVEVSNVAQKCITRNVTVVILWDLTPSSNTVNSQGPYNTVFLFIISYVRYIFYIFHKTGAL